MYNYFSNRHDHWSVNFINYFQNYHFSVFPVSTNFLCPSNLHQFEGSSVFRLRCLYLPSQAPRLFEGLHSWLQNTHKPSLADRTLLLTSCKALGNSFGILLSFVFNFTRSRFREVVGFLTSSTLYRAHHFYLASWNRIRRNYAYWRCALNENVSFWFKIFDFRKIKTTPPG